MILDRKMYHIDKTSQSSPMWMIISIILIFVLIYFLVDTENKEKYDEKMGGDTNPDTDNMDQDKKKKKKDIKNGLGVYLKSLDKFNGKNKYVYLNEMTRLLRLSDQLSERQEFRLFFISKKKKKNNKNKKESFNTITLVTSDDYYIGLKYTPFAKQEYDIGAINKKTVGPINDTISNQYTLELYNYKKGYFYIKLFNGHYLCVDSSGNLFSNINPHDVFFFKFEKSIKLSL